MNYQAKTFSPSSDTCDCYVFVMDDSKNSANNTYQQLNEIAKGNISRLIELGDFKGQLEESRLLVTENPQCPRILLLGMGKASSFNERALQKMTTSCVNALKNSKIAKLVLDFQDHCIFGKNTTETIRQAILQFESCVYTFEAYKTKKSENNIPKDVIFPIDSTQDKTELDKAILFSTACAKGMELTKTLGNLPSNICTPRYLASIAEQLAKDYIGIETTIFDEKILKEKGFNTLLAVAQGSQEPPRLVTIEYKGTDSSNAPIAIVGKGITFDTGGIWLKPPEGMDEMKYDMLGAATVLGVIKAAAELKLAINIVGIIACAENMPSGTAIKPADIVTSLSGKTVEIINTDAEGRLVLCDALTYAGEFKPSKVIDIATLTGAIIIALGPYATGLFSNNPELSGELLKAGDDIFDKVWPMPLVEEYQQRIDSRFADVMNVSGDRVAGSIIAACFLARFTENYAWAHLDIAATGSVSGKEKGATGRPVPLLLQFLVNQID